MKTKDIKKKDSQTMLAEKAMLVVLNVSRWTARKYDREVSKEVAEQKNAVADSGRYHKRLLPGGEGRAPKLLEDVRKAADAARAFHYTNSLPWGLEGSRILSKDNYLRYVEGMRKLRDQFKAAVSLFLTDYPQMQQAAKKALGDLYDEDDYPTSSQLGRKFDFSFEFLPFPSAEDFRVQISERDVDAIKEQIEETSAKAVELAMKDLWRRLDEAIKRIIERLSDPDGRFHDTMITSLRDLCKLIPNLNIGDDKNLERIANQANVKLASVSPDVLRQDTEARKKAAMDAKQIADMMSQYF